MGTTQASRENNECSTNNKTVSPQPSFENDRPVQAMGDFEPDYT